MAPPKLELIAGGKRDVRVEIAVLADGKPRIALDAIVFEEDTHLVLSADPVVREVSEHPIRLMTALHSAEPSPPGLAVVRPGRPVRILAVVHDLDLEPSCTEESVMAAANAALDAAVARGLRSIGMPLLGAVHGVLSVDTSARTLARVLAERGDRGAKDPARIVVLVEPGDEERVRALLT